MHEVYAVDVLISTGEGKVRRSIELDFNACIETVALGGGVSWHMFIIFLNSGEGRGSEDHRLQKRPQQGVRPKDEVIPDVVQRHREALRYDAFYSEVTFFPLPQYF